MGTYENLPSCPETVLTTPSQVSHIHTHQHTCNTQTGSGVSPTPIIIDFDWAGKETEAKYPSSINKNVLWPTDVIAKGLIKYEHDNKMVNQLFIY